MIANEKLSFDQLLRMKRNPGQRDTLPGVKSQLKFLRFFGL